MTARIDVMRSMMAAWAAGDIDRVIGHLHPDIVWHYAASTHPPVRGLDQCRKMMLRLQPEMSDVEWTVFGHAESGDRLFLEGVDSYTAANGARIATPYAGVIDFAGDLIVGWRDYVDLGVAAAQRSGEAHTTQVEELLARPAV